MPTSPSANIDRLQKETRKLGCPDLVELSTRTAVPEQLEYLDLLPGRCEAKLLPDAVVEFQGRPVLYLVDAIDEYGRVGVKADEITDLCQLLANRSEHACLAIVQPGQVTVYPIHLDRKILEAAEPKIISVADPSAPLFFHSLATGTLRLKEQPKESDYVFEQINNLLTKATDDLMPALNSLEVLSLTGRSLFFRFLIDRKIAREEDLERISPQADELRDAFSTAEKAAATSAWLDETFNGDLLPLVPGLEPETSEDKRRRLYLRYYREASERTSQSVFQHLEAILRGWEKVSPGHFQQPLSVDWDDLHFAHIPVGVLSQVYENFSHQIDSQESHDRSVHYTPVKIARLMVTEALGNIKDTSKVRILDSSCGAGVFLVLSFRHLVRRRWELDKERPKKEVIHQILYQQLTGFDVSESALRLASLALYISAIEVNATTRPANLLKHLKPLKENVLFNVDFDSPEGDSRKQAFILGSLSPKLDKNFDGRFDVVVGNPPWTRLRPNKGDDEKTKKEQSHHIKALNQVFDAIGRRVLAARGFQDLAKTYKTPDNDPDWPFLWRAMEWAKPGGILALALPARIILKQEGPGKQARNALLQTLTVMGILNGSDLEETSVWPNMKLPFMLLFARNAKAPENHAFLFATPLRENELAGRGEFRLDYTSAHAVQVSDVLAKPWLLKTLAVGTVMDVEVMARLLGSSFGKLEDVWMGEMHHGKGYNLNPRSKKRCPEWFGRLSVFQANERGQMFARTPISFCEKFGDKAPESPRKYEIYRAPLVVLSKSVADEITSTESYRIHETDAAYNNSFYGYSAGKHPDGPVLLALLHIVRHSLLFRYWLLNVSAEFGANFRTFLKNEIDIFPFPSASQLKADQKRRIIELADALDAQDPKAREKINSFIFDLYSLSDDEALVVRETVMYQTPFQSVRIIADAAPSDAQVMAFTHELHSHLASLVEVGESPLSIATLQPVTLGYVQHWRFILLRLDDGQEVKPTNAFLASLMREADKTAASRVVMHLPNNSGLLLGLLNRQRHWTRSRARLCARHIIRSHLDAFPIR
jgi:hypothetical protein